MKSQQQIASVIDSQSKKIVSKAKGIARLQKNNIKLVDNFACIITGVRRCGKSTLMLQLIDEFDADFLYLNFEDIRLSGFEVSDFIRLDNEIETRKVEYLFFDEIQIIDQWEIFVHQKLNEGYKVIITGSNASLLSREMGTHLTGRYLPYELFPFSYSEFLQMRNVEPALATFDDYMQTGGMPEMIKTGQGQILLQMLDDILVRDIAIRYSIRDINALRQLTVFLISNIGKPTSARKLTQSFGIKSASTISEYFSYLNDAYILDFVPVFDYSIKVQVRNSKKVYVIDTGIFNEVKTAFTDDLGRQLENIIYLHLRHSSNEIYYFNKNGECDFIVMSNNRIQQCIQVCYHLNDMNMQREINGLKEALKFFKLKEGVIVTHNQSDVFIDDEAEIRLIPAYEYLQDEN